MKNFVFRAIILFGIGLIINKQQSDEFKKLITENEELKQQLSISNMEKDKLYKRIGKLLTDNNKNL